MNRTLRAATFAVIVFGSLNAIGCMNGRSVQEKYYDYVDPCWPERYSQQARVAVLAPFDAQVSNGQIIDQTIWNYHFKEGSDELNAHGRQKLDGLARRLPQPDGRLYLQTARDLTYDVKNPSKLVADRATLDNKRANAILAYIGTQPASQNGNVRFEVQALDAFDPGVNSSGPATSVRGLPAQYRSTLTGMAGGNLSGAGGGAAMANPGQGQLQQSAPAGSNTTPR